MKKIKINKIEEIMHLESQGVKIGWVSERLQPHATFHQNASNGVFFRSIIELPEEKRLKTKETTLKGDEPFEIIINKEGKELIFSSEEYYFTKGEEEKIGYRIVVYETDDDFVTTGNFTVDGEEKTISYKEIEKWREKMTQDATILHFGEDVVKKKVMKTRPIQGEGNFNLKNSNWQPW